MKFPRPLPKPWRTAALACLVTALCGCGGGGGSGGADTAPAAASNDVAHPMPLSPAPATPASPSSPSSPSAPVTTTPVAATTVNEGTASVVSAPTSKPLDGTPVVAVWSLGVDEPAYGIDVCECAVAPVAR